MPCPKFSQRNRLSRGQSLDRSASADQPSGVSPRPSIRGRTMRKNLMIQLAAILSVLLAANTFCLGQSKKLEDEANQAGKAARVLTEIMGAPDKAIPIN